MNYSMNQLPPDFWIDVLAIIMGIIMILAIIYAVKESFDQAMQISEAYEVVDTTFAHTWDGDRQLELYAWTATFAKLHGHDNPYIDAVIEQRVNEFYRRKERLNNRRRSYHDPNEPMGILHDEKESLWQPSLLTHKPTI